MTSYVALLRGINIGRSKRVAMAELRGLVESLGFSNVRTLLSSGNVIFDAEDDAEEEAAALIRQGLINRLGVDACVIVISAADVTEILELNPFSDAGNPSRLLIGVLSAASDRDRLGALIERDWGDERLGFGQRAVYLWIPDGVKQSRLYAGLDRVMADRVTTRNLSTMMRIAEAATRGEA